MIVFIMNQENVYLHKYFFLFTCTYNIKIIHNNCFFHNVIHIKNVIEYYYIMDHKYLNVIDNSLNIII